MLNIIKFFFFYLIYTHAWFVEKKNMQRKVKAKRSKYFIYDYKRVF